jgi:hypothetical protein
LLKKEIKTYKVVISSWAPPSWQSYLLLKSSRRTLLLFSLSILLWKLTNRVVQSIRQLYILGNDGSRERVSSELFANVFFFHQFHFSIDPILFQPPPMNSGFLEFSLVYFNFRKPSWCFPLLNIASLLYIFIIVYYKRPFYLLCGNNHHFTYNIWKQHTMKIT